MDISRVARIARWEVMRHTGNLDRRTAAIALVVVLAAAALGPFVLQQGVTVDDDIYRVGVSDSSPYHQSVAAHSTLVAEEPDIAAVRAGDQHLAVTADGLRVADSPAGKAALAEFRTAVETENVRLMSKEEDQAAAFPVYVSLEYVEQDGTVQSVELDTDEESNGDSSDTGNSDNTRQESQSAESDDGGDGGLSVPDVGGGTGPLASSGDRGTPADISPPFPFEALLLAFVFVIPMNFVIQGYASSIIGERINRRGEALLASPATPVEIVTGKTLPYFAAMVLVASVLAVAVGGGGIAIAAVVPIALVFLASSFVGAMFARSFKELTFVTVAISVTLTTYVFVPAVFTQVHPIAVISPLTLVVQDLQANAVSAGEYAFSTAPFYLSSIVLFGLGIGVYREEDMFARRPLHEKLLDAVAARLSGWRSVPALTALFLPFVLAGQLIAIAILFVTPPSIGIPVLLCVAAVMEELAKSIHVFAGFDRSVFDSTTRSAIGLGAASGIGFFAAEKFTHITHVVGLQELGLGRTAFGSAQALGAESPLTVAAFFFAPLVLHVVTATISALGARRNTSWYVLAFGAATLVHFTYNFTVVMVLA